MPVLGLSFSKFIAYNHLVLDDVKKTFPDTHTELGDPNKVLAVVTCTDTVTVFGQVRYSLRDGNDRRDSTNMNNLNRHKYMVSLEKWVKNNYIVLSYEAETLSEMKKATVPKSKAFTWVPKSFLT